jgi:hypothetical protein
MKHLLLSLMLAAQIGYCLSVSVSEARFDAGESEATQRAGEHVDLARYGKRILGDDFLAVQWDSPRDVCEVSIEGIDGNLAQKLRLEWWASVWPANGTGGWMRLDDEWNGRWITVDTKAQRTDDKRFVFRFPPLVKSEWDNALPAEQYPDKREPAFRRTLKVRLRAENQRIEGEHRLQVFGASRWRLGSFDIETRRSQDEASRGQIEIINGELLSIESLPKPRDVKLTGTQWTGKKPQGASTGVRIQILYADSNDLNSNELTRVTVRQGRQPKVTGFSFVPQDVTEHESIRLPDFGTLVSESRRSLSLASDQGPDAKAWKSPVRERIPERPEMTRQMAMAGIPRLSPARWVPVGVPSARQEFFVGPNGDWMITALSLNTDTGRDAKRWVFKKDFGNERQWDEFYTILDTRAEPKFDGGDRQNVRRYLADGFLPLICVEWDTGPIHYRHELTTTILMGEYDDDATRRGDETVVLLSKLELTNTGDQDSPATVNLRYSIAAPIALQADGLIRVGSSNGSDQQGLYSVRGLISMDKPAGGGAADWEVRPVVDAKSSAILHWQDKLAPSQKRLVYFKAPFVELLEAEELKRLGEISFEQEKPIVLDYWRRRLANGMQMEVPDEALNNFYKANLWHNVITTDRDPKTGLYNHGVATVRYRVFANETVMVARSMDMRGEHIEAERFLEPMLHYQGTEALKGIFSTKKGVFHGAGEYTHGEYAMNHGFVLWGIADHYLMTRDRAYLDRVAPRLIEACDFLIRERRSTMSGPAVIHGLCPASSLEDVVEYQYWFATNAYFYLGMKRAAQALGDIGQADGQRIADEAEKYRRDIEACVREATSRSAVVRLRDGNYIPYVPSRVFQWRHLTEGWIREALYCSLHLATAEVLSPNDRVITWMLDDLEDNIFFSWQSGYNVSDYQQRWFERGGVTLQPCLLDMPIVYMARDEIPAALRAFWNTYALSIYPDVHCFAEWASRFGVAGGPVYKTSDESRFVMWLRQLLVWENDQQLWLARAVPKEWLEDGKSIIVKRAQSLFGPVDMTIRSAVKQERITAELLLPRRNPPAEVWLRLRHPEGLYPKRVFVNDRLAEPADIRGGDIRIVAGPKEPAGSVKVTAEYEAH